MPPLANAYPSETSTAQRARSDVRLLGMRAKRIRRLIVRLAATPTGCHLGGSLSIVEILVALLGGVMSYDPRAPLSEGRDHLILSKGHAAAGLYSALAEFGFFDAEELVQKYNADASIFMGHVNALVPGVDFSTGSLGHGLGLGVGLALGYRLRSQSNHVYVICGDGELGEGSNWEALQVASHHRLSHLTVIVDRNGGQNDGPTEDILSQAALAERLGAFGFQVSTVDGHELSALGEALGAPSEGRPRAIIANTRKGAGLPMLRGRSAHYAVFTAEQLQRALKSLGEEAS
jgi:transketolase